MQYPSGPAQGSATLSPDGLFLWDGRQWIPTVSTDGRWRWNGTGWEPTAPQDPADPAALAQTLTAQADETFAQAGALLAARRADWQAEPGAQSLLLQADQLAGAVQAGNAHLANFEQQNVLNRALAGNERRRIEIDLGQSTASLRAVIIQIGRTAPPVTFPDADVLLNAARHTDALGVEIGQAMASSQQAEARHASRLAAAQAALQEAENSRAAALAGAMAAVQAARQAHERAVADARLRLGGIRMPGAGEPVATFAGVALYAHHLQTPDGRGLTEGAEAATGPAPELVAQHPVEVGEALALSSAGAAAFHEAETAGSEQSFLLLWGTGLRSLVPVAAGQEEAAAAFTGRVHEASAAAGARAAGRASMEREARTELQTVGAQRSEISAAEAEQRKLEADPELLARVEAARADRESAGADQSEVLAERSRLAAAINEALTPPPPLIG